jgi:hypothetical protein
MFRHATAIITVILCCATIVQAQEAVTRTYDLGDLLRVTRHYPLDSSMIPATRLRDSDFSGGGTGGQGLFPGSESGAAPAAEPTVTPEAITALVMETVAPETWRDKGGSAGALRFLGTQLIVTQTPDAHKQIADLLEQLNAGGAHMVAIRAQWVTFSPTELREIFARASQQEGGGAIAEVADNLLRDDNVYSQGQTLGYNGQTVHIASTRGKTVVTGMSPVVGTNAVGYDLSTTVIQSGVALQVTPHVMNNGQTVALDLRSVVSEVEGSAEKAAQVPQTQPMTEQQAMLMVDQPGVVAQQFSTTVRVPAGRKILIGGMTLDSADAGGARQLYLVVEATASK